MICRRLLIKPSLRQKIQRLFLLSQTSALAMLKRAQLQSIAVTTLSSKGTLGIKWQHRDLASRSAVRISRHGKLKFTPAANANGAGYDSFKFTVNDGTADSSASSTMTIDVTAVNDSPVAVTDSYTTLQNTQLTGTVGSNDLLQNDSDADPDVLAVNTTPVSNVTNGTLTLATDGSFTYSPSSTFFGNDSFTYQVTDGNGGTDTANVTISVTLKPDVFQPLSSGGYDSTGTWDQGAAPDKDASVLLNNAFTVTQSNSGSLADNVSISGSGAELIVSGGTFDVATSVTIATGSKLTNTGGALTVGTTITNAGALLFDDGSIAANSIVNTGTINIKTGVIMTIGPDDVSVPSYYSGTGHYYEYVSTGVLSANAQAAAAAKSYAGATGYLATILDAGENAFIKELIGSTAWIGLSDTATENEFRWLDGPEAGQLATYTNWFGSNEPNNAGGGQDYTVMRKKDGKWDDTGAPGGSNQNGYVVEYSRDATTHSNTGTINVDSGATLKFVSNDILENSGDIKGSGTLDFSSENVFKNSGRIDVGDSDATGILTIKGTTELKEDSELIFQLAGETKGTQYDALSFTQGVTTLGGRLRINSTVYTHRRCHLRYYYDNVVGR